MSQHARSEPPHGTMAEEAARLADVAHLWLASQSFGRPGAGGSGGTAGAATDSGDVWAEESKIPGMAPTESRPKSRC